jgi:hypothetical protein
MTDMPPDPPPPPPPGPAKDAPAEPADHTVMVLRLDQSDGHVTGEVVAELMQKVLVAACA